MTVISTACHQLTQPREAFYISVVPLEEEKKSLFINKNEKKMFYKKASLLVEEKKILIFWGVCTNYNISLGERAIKTLLNCKRIQAGNCET